MNLSFLIAFMKCRSAAAANHISGWIGAVVAGGAAWLVSNGYVQQIRDFVCNASNDDIGLAIAAIGAAASFLNTGTTAALSPPKQQEEPVQEPEQKNSDLERVSQPYPGPKRR